MEFPCIVSCDGVGNTHLAVSMFQPEVEEDRKKSKIGMHKEGIISAGCGLIGMLFIGV